MKGITLLGMPGAGKSMIGKILAKKLDWRFIDLDELILEKRGLGHTEILKLKGRNELLRLENQCTLELNLEDLIFSPGGSIVYAPAAMEKLKAETRIIFLDVSLEKIKKRVGDNLDNARGIVDFENKGWEGLFAERRPLYQSYAHHTLEIDDDKEIEIMNKIFFNFLNELPCQKRKNKIN